MQEPLDKMLETLKKHKDKIATLPQLPQEPWLPSDKTSRGWAALRITLTSKGMYFSDEYELEREYILGNVILGINTVTGIIQATMRIATLARTVNFTQADFNHNLLLLNVQSVPPSISPGLRSHIMKSRVVYSKMNSLTKKSLDSNLEDVLGVIDKEEKKEKRKAKFRLNWAKWFKGKGF